MSTPPVTSAQAAELLNVPPARTARWVSEGRVHPRGTIPGRGRNGRVPLFDLADFQPLADAYHTRTRHAHTHHLPHEQPSATMNANR